MKTIINESATDGSMKGRFVKEGQGTRKTSEILADLNIDTVA